MNLSTPFLPGLRHRLAPMGSRIASRVQTFRKFTFDQLEERFSSFLPKSLFPKSSKGLNSRDSIYTQNLTFWCALWQVITPGTSDRTVVRHLQAQGVLRPEAPISSEDSAYCQARGRLSTEGLKQALGASAKAARSEVKDPEGTFLQGRPIKVADGSSTTLPDSPQNQAKYPKVHSPKSKHACGFPIMRVVVLFCLLSGAILSVASGSLSTSELSLLRQLIPQLSLRDILLGDRGFGNYTAIYLLQQAGIDFIGRSNRRVDGRRRSRKLGRNDWLVTWKRSGSPSKVMSPDEWDLVPKQMTVRIVRGRYTQKGFRLREVTLVTTLLDTRLYPAEEILRAYGRRWRLEMCLDDLKTTLGMEMLSWKSPEKVQKELYLHLIGHNLVRWVMARAATLHDQSIERLSFKGSLDAMKEFGKAMDKARSKKQRRQIEAELFRVIAQDLVPERPGRREPRAVKRVKTKYPRLHTERHLFKDREKRNRRRSKAKRLRRLTLFVTN